MELRGQDREIRMPTSLSYNNPPTRDSSSKVPSASMTPLLGERRGDHHQFYHHHHQLNLQNQTHKPTSDHQQDLVPDPAAATSGTNTSRSVSRSPPPPPPTITSSTSSSTRYRECLKNHAASRGGHVVDGCGEFMPSGEEGTLEALKCAACECHRNFHRKEIDGEPQHVANSHYKSNYNQRNTLPPPPQQLATTIPPPPAQQFPLHQHHRFHHHMSAPPVPIAPVMMNFGGGAAAESSSEDLNMFQSSLLGQAASVQATSKKRFRTKFSQEQKDKMMEFAEKLGWRIQKQDEQEVQQFCSQVGVRRKVFKVWMHNNKQAMKKKQM